MLARLAPLVSGSQWLRRRTGPDSYVFLHDVMIAIRRIIARMDNTMDALIHIGESTQSHRQSIT
jgi:hypothetical protein